MGFLQSQKGLKGVSCKVSSKGFHSCLASCLLWAMAVSKGCWILRPAQKGVKSLIPLMGDVKNLKESALVFGRGSLIQPQLAFPQKVRLHPPLGDSLLLGRAVSPAQLTWRA